MSGTIINNIKQTLHIPSKKTVTDKTIFPWLNVDDKFDNSNKKVYEFKIKDRLISRDTIGEINDKAFYITHTHSFLNSDKISGVINRKKVEIEINEMPIRTKITGTIGNKKIDLTLLTTWDGKEVSGNYGETKVELKIKRGINSFSIIGDETNLSIGRVQLFSGSGKMEGQFKEEDELFPILINEIYCTRNTELTAITSTLAGYG